MAALVAAQHPLINEVVPGGGGAGDWLEVYNPTARTIDLLGYTFVTLGRAHRVEVPLPVASHGYQVLWCDRRTEKGPEHLDLKLPREGGSLLLIDRDRSTVRDVFSWSALPTGVSLGRLRDGQQDWGYFTDPTPGASNSASPGARLLLPAPVPVVKEDSVTCAIPEGAWLCRTFDGRIPGPDLPRFIGMTSPDTSCVLTLRAFGPDALPSPPVSITFPRKGTGPFIGLRVDPDSLFDPQRGILVAGEKANYARTGRDWQRSAQVEWHDRDTIRREEVRLSVSGSGTRGQPKKNFKLYGEEETMLRADATPHAFLRAVFLEAVARGGAALDVQPSTPLPLYLNGGYAGLYRAMPAKNGEWLSGFSGAESIDLIDGPGARALQGDNDQHARLLGMLERGAPLDSLAQLMEVNSLLDLACFDLYSGRADHDLNTRCWRPKVQGGRWRWILFDMDLWAPPDEGTVARMCSATAPESPYLPWLLAHEELGPRLLARLSAWLAGSLATDRAATLTDSLYDAHAPQMREDHERWKESMGIPSPEASIALLRDHIHRRPALLLAQLADHTDTKLRKVTLRVVPEGGGEIAVEQLPLTDGERSFTALAGTRLQFSAHPAPGYIFFGWEGASATGTTISVDPADVKSLRAVFRQVGSSE